MHKDPRSDEAEGPVAAQPHQVSENTENGPVEEVSPARRPAQLSQSSALPPSFEPATLPSREDVRSRRQPLTETKPPRTRKVGSGLFRFLREVLLVIVFAAVIALLLRAFVVQVYRIPSESMNDTLAVGSRIAVNHIPGIGKDVERGDVVVFRDSEGWLPSNGDATTSLWSTVGSWFGFAPPGGEQIIVKRIIGVGGDTVTCCNAEGQISVNGTAIAEPYLASNAVPSLSDFSVTVPEGHYFVMGDNRQNSADSLYHYERGEAAFIPKNAVIGKAQFEIWPPKRWSSLGNRGVFDSVSDAG